MGGSNKTNGTLSSTHVVKIDDPTADTTCRFISQQGKCMIRNVNTTQWYFHYMSDILTTCIDLQWRYTILIFVLLYVASWLLFGIIYYIISFVHKDFTTQYIVNGTDIQLEPFERSCLSNLTVCSPVDVGSRLDTTCELSPTLTCSESDEFLRVRDCYAQVDAYEEARSEDKCFTDITSFVTAVLFSYETQTTIGYGGRHPTERCPSAVFAVMVQSVLSTLIDAFAIGWIIAKISRPKKRAETLLFSRNAVINMRDGQLCLMVRVGNLRKSVLVEACIRMQIVRQGRITDEGECIPFEQIDLDIDLGNDSDKIFLVTPQIIVHPIIEDSPLFEIGPNDLRGDKWEIVVVLEGMVEATGGTTQARASYLPSEIYWGRRFKNVVTRGQRDKGYLINFKHFHELYESNNPPKCSAKDMAQMGEDDKDDDAVFSIGQMTNEASITGEQRSSVLGSNTSSTQVTTPVVE